MKSFIVATNSAPTIVRDALTAFLQTRPWGYWHHVNDLWIIAELPDEYTAQKLWNEITTAVPICEPVTMLVLSMDQPRTYWGRGPRPGWDWLKQYFGNSG